MRHPSAHRSYGFSLPFPVVSDSGRALRRKSASIHIGILNESVVHGRLVRNAVEDLDDVSVGVFREVAPFKEFVDTEAHVLAIVEKATLPHLEQQMLEEIRDGGLPTLVTAHELSWNEALAVVRVGVGEIVLFPDGFELVSKKVNDLIAETDYRIQPMV